MKKLAVIVLMLLTLNACSNPKSSNLSLPELNDTTALASKIDSVHTVSQDGLDYDPLNTGTYDQLPAPVTEWLNQHYAGWSLPAISAEYLRGAKNNAPGPYCIQTDFDQNQLVDYAVLYQHQDLVTATALLQNTNGFRAYVLARSPLVTRTGEKQSLTYLMQKKKGSEVFNKQKQKVILSQNAIGVGSYTNTRLYIFNGHSFTSFDVAEKAN